MDFVAFDFETANEKRVSACSLAVVVVENNMIVETRHWYIKPHPNRFNAFNSSLTGITENDVEDAPTFDALWPEIFKYFDQRIVVAHNASFDASVLFQLLDHYQLQVPDFRTICTYKLSQSVHPQLSCFRLNILCSIYNIPLKHHDAVSDACACSSLLMRYIESSGVDTLSDLQTALAFQAGRSNCSPCFLNSTRRPSSKRIAEPELIKDLNSKSADYYDDDFYGKYFVFTGTLLSMPRAKALEIVSRGGGFLENSVTKKTNYLVVGIQDMSRIKEGKSAKMMKAEMLRDLGQDIEIIAEDDFLEMIDGNLYDLCMGIQLSNRRYSP